MALNLKQVFRFGLIGFYAFAGSYHFINPEFYHGLIPVYLPFPELINYLAGIIEIVLAIGVAFEQTRKLSIYGIVAMLIAFIPSHIYFIQIGSCIDDSLCVAPWIAWMRLLVIHPILILWAWKVKD
ncbi:MAG: hypothetical protein AAGH46_05295 [Bacteroidota bacterium]